MKILEIITSLSSGGGERFVTDLSNELSKHPGCEVELLTIKDDTKSEMAFYKEEVCENVEYNCLGVSKYTLKTPFLVLKAIRKRKPDVVHVHLNGTFNMAIPALFLYRRPLYVQTLHGRADKQFASKPDYWLKRLIYSLSLVKLITISSDNNKSFRTVYHVPSNGMILNGRGKMKTLDLIKVKQEIDSYKPSEDTLVLIHVARLHPEKNQSLLIQGVNKIIEQGANVILLIIGAGYNTEKGKELQVMACNRVHFLGLKTNVSDYLKCADAFVLSSLNEAMPISLIEALACRCIPLSTPVSGSIDIIKNGENGFITKDFSLNSFVEMLNDFMANHSQINREMLHHYFQKNLSIQTCANKYLSFFHEHFNHP